MKEFTTVYVLIILCYMSTYFRQTPPGRVVYGAEISNTSVAKPEAVVHAIKVSKDFTCCSLWPLGLMVIENFIIAKQNFKGLILASFLSSDLRCHF